MPASEETTRRTGAFKIMIDAKEKEFLASCILGTKERQDAIREELHALVDGYLNEMAIGMNEIGK